MDGILLWLFAERSDGRLKQQSPGHTGAVKSAYKKHFAFFGSVTAIVAQHSVDERNSLTPFRDEQQRLSLIASDPLYGLTLDLLDEPALRDRIVQTMTGDRR